MINKNIYIIGASIGNAWDINNFTNRVKNIDMRIQYKHGGSGFDKSKVIKELIYSDSKPDYLIIKECAAYFPVELNTYKSLLKEWYDLCNDNNIKLILSTVIPVTKSHEIKKNIYYFIRRRSNDFITHNPFKNTKNKSIVEYNNWIRDFAFKNKIYLLDFAMGLKMKNSDYLNSSYARIDGLHINKYGYSVMDMILENAIKNDFK